MLMEPPVKVLQLVLSLAIGGTEKLVYDLVHRVNKRLVSPIVCCLDEPGQFGEELEEEGFCIYTLGRSPGLDWRIINKIGTLLKEEQIEVVHAHQYTPYFYGLLGALYCKMLTRSRRPGVVFTEHGRFYPERRNLKRMLANPFFSLATDEIVTISESTKASLITYENFPARRIQVVYNGIDLSRFSLSSDGTVTKQRLGLADDDHVIGIIARLDPIKNHAMLLRAFPQILEKIPDTYLLIVGPDGPEKENIERLIISLGITENVRLLGARNDIADLLQACDVFALSSFSEGTSVTLLEAMAAAVPIVATNVGGNPEVIENKVTGYLVPSDDDVAMAEKLILLLQDTQIRERMGKAAQDRAHAKFSLEKMVSTYTDLYLKARK